VRKRDTCCRCGIAPMLAGTQRDAQARLKSSKLVAHQLAHRAVGRVLAHCKTREQPGESGACAGLEPRRRVAQPFDLHLDIACRVGSARQAAQTFAQILWNQIVPGGVGAQDTAQPRSATRKSCNACASSRSATRVQAVAATSSCASASRCTARSGGSANRARAFIPQPFSSASCAAVSNQASVPLPATGASMNSMSAAAPFLNCTKPEGLAESSQPASWPRSGS